MIGDQLKLKTVHIYILFTYILYISKYKPKTGIHIRESTVGLAMKTL